MDWSNYILVGMGFAALIFGGAVYALVWAHRNGQFDNLEAGAKSIFDEDEPIGEMTDAFPSRKKKTSGTSSSDKA